MTLFCSFMALLFGLAIGRAWGGSDARMKYAEEDLMRRMNDIIAVVARLNAKAKKRGGKR